MTHAPSKDASQPPAPPATVDGTSAAEPSKAPDATSPATRPREIGGPKGPEPTRYGDWEVGGRCSDF